MIKTDPELGYRASQLSIEKFYLEDHGIDVSGSHVNTTKVCEQIKLSSGKLLENVEVPSLKNSFSAAKGTDLKSMKIFQT